MDVPLTFGYFIRFKMLFWFTNLPTSNIFSSIALVVECFSYFRMIYSSLDAMLVLEFPYFTELASLATYFSITLVIGCFTYFRMLHSSLDAILAYESYFTELAFKCYSHLRNSLLHGARFGRKISFNHTCRSMRLSLSDALFVLRCYSNLLNHTCRWMFLLFSDALFVFGYYSCFRILGIHLASRSSLRSQNII